MEMVDVADAELGVLLERVRRGETVVLGVDGVAVADLVPRSRPWTDADDAAFLAADAEVAAMFDDEIWPTTR